MKPNEEKFSDFILLLKKHTINADSEKSFKYHLKQWILRNGNSIELTKFLIEKLRLFNDNVLVIRSKYYPDESEEPEYNYTDYKEIAIDWLIEYRIDLGDEKFDVFKEDIIHRIQLIQTFPSHELYNTYPEYIEYKIELYENRVKSLKNKLGAFFEEKINKKVRSLQGLPPNLYDEEANLIVQELKKELLSPSFDYISELKELYLIRISELAEDKVRKEDLTTLEQVILLEYIIKEQVLSEIKDSKKGYSLISTYKLIGSLFNKNEQTLKSAYQEFDYLDECIKGMELQQKTGQYIKLRLKSFCLRDLLWIMDNSIELPTFHKNYSNNIKLLLFYLISNVPFLLEFYSLR